MAKTNSKPIVSKEVFHEVFEPDMPKVLKALQKDWPTHFLLHQQLTILDKYAKAGCKWKHNLYLCGDYEHGVYLNRLVYELPTKEVTQLYIYTTNSDLSELKRSLKQTHLIQWKNKNFLFPMIDSKFLGAIEEACLLNGVKYNIHNNTMFWYPTDKEINPKTLPDDFYEDFLDTTYAEEMDMNWPHRYPGSELVNKENLQNNFGYGIFRKSDKRLVSSALCNYTGGIFVLYSDPEFRGRGLATRLMERMTREIKQRGYIPFCTVIIGNKPSETVFNNVGFERFTNVNYIFSD